ncbi:unnamed protein product, partial [Effrenium voratum]
PIWNLRELRPDEELVMSERYNFGQDVKDCLYFLTWEIAEDRTLEAWDGQNMQMNVGVIGVVWREYVKGILLEILETMEVLEYLLGILLEVKGNRRLVQEEDRLANNENI